MIIVGLCVGMVALGFIAGYGVAAWGSVRADEYAAKVAKTGRCPTCGRWP